MEIHQTLFSATTNKNGKKRSGNETILGSLAVTRGTSRAITDYLIMRTKINTPHSPVDHRSTKEFPKLLIYNNGYIIQCQLVQTSNHVLAVFALTAATLAGRACLSLGAGFSDCVDNCSS